LHAIGPLVSRVAKLSFVAFRERRIALKIRAGQIVEQHIELRREEVLPTCAQVLEERRFVSEHLVQAAVKSVLFHQRIIFPQEIAHRTLLKPLSVQSPFAARIHEPITHQGLQNMAPAGALPAIGQARPPKLIEPKLLVKLARQPAGTPLPSSMQFKLLKAHPYP
jgi:hypothetical protein